jgi:Excinuclease ABC subunit A
VDGQLLELDEIPALDKKRKHRIEAVIDRLVLRGDSGPRLAESLETALGLAEDQAIASHGTTACGRATVFRSPCLPRLRALLPALGAAPLLLQQSRRGLPAL